MADIQMPDSRRLKLAEQGQDPADEPDENMMDEQDEPKKKTAKKK